MDNWGALLSISISYLINTPKYQDKHSELSVQFLSPEEKEWKSGVEGSKRCGSNSLSSSPKSCSELHCHDVVASQCHLRGLNVRIMSLAR